MFSLWDPPSPLPGVSDPLGGAGALPCPSSLGDVMVAALMKPKRRGRVLQLGGDVLGLVPCLPCWPPLPCDPARACWGWREPWQPGLHWLLAGGRGRAVRRGLAGVPPPPPLLRGGRLADPLCCPPGLGVPFLAPAVMPSWATHP